MTDLAGYGVARLARTLRGQLRGTVSTGGGDRAPYTADASNYRVVPDLVVIPKDVDDLAAAVTISAQAGAPVTVRGLVRGQEVLLWPDTFTNYLTPEIGREAVEVLEDAGLQVRLPTKAADPDAVVLADGFSCRTQIRGGAGREAVHLPQLLASALDPRRGEDLP